MSCTFHIELSVSEFVSVNWLLRTMRANGPPTAFRTSEQQLVFRHGSGHLQNRDCLPSRDGKISGGSSRIGNRAISSTSDRGLVNVSALPDARSKPLASRRELPGGKKTGTGQRT